MTRRLRFCLLLLCSATLASCSLVEGEDDVDIAFVGAPEDVRQTGVRLSPVGQHLRAASAEGLVAFDAQGDVVPALAERWIVTDDGLSYIFRLRDSNWPDGRPMTAESVKREFERTLSRLDGTSLGFDTDIIADVRAMAGRVVEIRLDHPMAEFLALLAQPELGLLRDNRGQGPMRAVEEGGLVTLVAIAPQERGLPGMEYWDEIVRPVKLRSYDAAAAVKAFEQGDADAVLGGRIQNLPLADLGPLSRGTIRVDPVIGLLGLQVMRTTGLVEGSAEREALSMAIDRGGLFEALNLGQWQQSTRIVPYLPGIDDAPPTERWAALTIDQRRSQAARRIAAWQSASGKPARVSILLPEGPGSDRVFGALAADFKAIGVTLVRVEKTADADLALFDRVARYAGRRWFLNQFNCRVERLLCSRDADLAVLASLHEGSAAEREKLLDEAEGILLDRNAYIPLGTPVRWSLVRSGVDGFEANRTGLHPLFPLAMRPI